MLHEVVKTMFYTKVNKLHFNAGRSLDVRPNDIFVGSNNCGKSQSLRDIYRTISDKGKSIVVKDVDIEKGSLSELKECIIANSKQVEDKRYKGYSYDIREYQLEYNSGPKLNNALRSYVVSFLKTEDRLSISNPPSAIDKNDTKTHPIHYILFDKEYQKQVSQYFNEAFEYELTPNYISRKSVPLCMGPVPIMQSGSAPEVMGKLEEVLDGYPKVHEQGDGMRSFAGIVLHLILKNYGLYLIDEPESFLHPPQARILGKVIGQLLGSDRQAFISTHSEDIIKGLIEECPDRIKVVRITRQRNENSFAILNNDQFNTIWRDPILKHSNIMSSLFHNDVVLCEGDADCRLYSIILDHLKSKKGTFSETLFIHCGSKNRMKPVAEALRSLSVSFRCVPDIDILDNETTIKDLFEACGGIWNEQVSSYYRQFVAGLNNGNDSISKTEVSQKVNSFLENHADERLMSNDIKKLFQELKIETKWSLLKQGGEAIIPSGNARVAYEALKNTFQSVNLYWVPVGELERFIPQVGGHGPRFVNQVLDEYPDYNNNVYAKVVEFVESWKL